MLVDLAHRGDRQHGSGLYLESDLYERLARDGYSTFDNNQTAI
jgi:hypothetical protein